MTIRRMAEAEGTGIPESCACNNEYVKSSPSVSCAIGCVQSFLSQLHTNGAEFCLSELDLFIAIFM
jgi:hypothetical protein